VSGKITFFVGESGAPLEMLRNGYLTLKLKQKNRKIDKKK